MPESLKELDAFIEGIKDNQAIRKQVAAIMPTLVKRVDMDIKDRLWPIFTFHLVNGGEVTFNRELVITGANGVTVTINKDTIRSSDGKLNRKRILSKTA